MGRRRGRGARRTRLRRTTSPTRNRPDGPALVLRPDAAPCAHRAANRGRARRDRHPPRAFAAEPLAASAATRPRLPARARIRTPARARGRQRRRPARGRALRRLGARRDRGPHARPLPHCCLADARLHRRRAAARARRSHRGAPGAVPARDRQRFCRRHPRMAQALRGPRRTRRPVSCGTALSG